MRDYLIAYPFAAGQPLLAMLVVFESSRTCCQQRMDYATAIAPEYPAPLRFASPIYPGPTAIIEQSPRSPPSPRQTID